MPMLFIVTYTSLAIEADSEDDAIDKATDFKGGGQWVAEPVDAKYVLVVTEGYEPPDVFGPFATIADAQADAESYRETQGLPREATAENNETWTAAGWYFGIVPLQQVEAA